MASAEEYEAEIAHLKAIIARLQRYAAPIETAPSTHSSSASFIGREEMVLELDQNDHITRINAPMMRLLGGEVERQVFLGQPIARWDEGPLPRGTLAYLIHSARTGAPELVIERACPRLPAERLPSPIQAPASAMVILRFSAAASSNGRLQLVAQDVTRLRWLEHTFARYVSPAVIAELGARSNNDLLEMTRREVTILFADLRGFSALAARISPIALQELINSFLANMAEGVDLLHGLIEGIAGDGLMVIFGAPLEQPDHALRGLICAVELHRRHKRWLEARNSQNLPTLPLGLGVATGPAVVGNLGTARHLHYTALGHTTNLAARLCGRAQGGEVLTTPETRLAADRALTVSALPQLRPRYQARGQLTLKNFEAPVSVLALDL
jgi:class 3 adenylate cyclase